MAIRDSIYGRQNQRKGLTMQAAILLQNQIQKSYNIHCTRLEALFTGVKALLTSSRLTVVGLGRGILNNIKVKSNINRMNRLVGNENLHSERIKFYSYLSRSILGNKTRPIISIDWSAITPGGQEQLIRATVSVHGRPLTVYESVYTNKTYNNPISHREFIYELKEVLPKTCKPIIVTDAGFGFSWFKLILAMGWDFLGRIRSNSYFRLIDNKNYIPCMSLYKNATAKATYIGEVLFTKQELQCHFHLVKKDKIGRKIVNLWGKISKRTNSLRCERKERDPWLLVTSLSKKECNSKRAVKVYESRMQIEESFRDLKNYRNGFALRASRSKSTKRFDILILIATLATYIAWLIGLAAKQKKIHFELQTNSVKDRDVLSIVTIGIQILRYKRFKLLKAEIMRSKSQIKGLIWDLECIIS